MNEKCTTCGATDPDDEDSICSNGFHFRKQEQLKAEQQLKQLCKFKAMRVSHGTTHGATIPMSLQGKLLINITATREQIQNYKGKDNAE